FRHGEIYPSDGGASFPANAPTHRLDEFPVGYSSAGWSPPLPASASPTDSEYAVQSPCRSTSFQRTARYVLTICLSPGGRCKAVPGFPTMDVAITNWSGISLGLGYYNGQRTYQVADNVAYSTGRQNIRFGFDYKNHLLDKSSFFLTGGSAGFTGQ